MKRSEKIIKEGGCSDEPSAGPFSQPHRSQISSLKKNGSSKIMDFLTHGILFSLDRCLLKKLSNG